MPPAAEGPSRPGSRRGGGVGSMTAAAAASAGALRIVVSGMLATVPHHGGASWAVLQYLLGLRRLGHDVWFVEPASGAVLQAGSAVVEYFDRVRTGFELDQAAL